MPRYTIGRMMTVFAGIAIPGAILVQFPRISIPSAILAIGAEAYLLVRLGIERLDAWVVVLTIAVLIALLLPAVEPHAGSRTRKVTAAAIVTPPPASNQGGTGP